MAYHDPIRQLKYLRQTLSQDKKPLAFFLSAGCPLAVSMPTGQWPLIPDVQGLTKFVSDTLIKNPKYKETFTRLLDELRLADNNLPNVEDLLSFIRGMRHIAKGAKDVRGFSESELESLESEICAAIASKLKVDLPNGNTPYHHLAKWTHNIDRDTPIEIFTTNYDLLIEEAFERIGLPYFDGFVGSKRPFFDIRAVEDSQIPKHWSRLWKVHGSINWFFSKEDRVYRSTNVDNNGTCLIYPSHLKYDESRKMPFLALIDRLNAFIRQSGSVLIISGYSFNDEHLNHAIVNALKANPSAIVIGLLFDKLGNYPRAIEIAEYRSNLSLWAFDEAIIGGLTGKWRPSKDLDNDDNIANAVRYTPKEMSVNGDNESGDQPFDIYELLLGDFAVLGHFLHELIGKEQQKLKDA